MSDRFVSDRSAAPGTEDPTGKLGEPLRAAVARWRADDDAPDFAPAVLRALREERRVDRPTVPRRWRHAGLATLAAGLLIAAGSFVLPPAADRGGEQAAAPTPVEPRVTPPAPAPPEPPPADADVPAVAAVERPRPPRPPSVWLPADRLALRDDLLPENLFTPERLSAAWEILPDPNRTWRDELRDGVRPYRDGVDNVVALFAEALPPRQRGS